MWALRALAKVSVDITLVDRNNYHTFLPLLYQVAAAEIEPEEINCPVRDLLRKQRNASFLMAEVKQVDWKSRSVKTNGPDISYDFLIIATGSMPHFFGVSGAAEHTFPLRTMEQSIALRNHILRCFEHAAHEPDTKERKKLLTFTVVGGGPTGVEFTGALAELVYGPLRKDYSGLNFQDVKIVLLEASPSLLSGMPKKLCTYSVERLRHMGVEVCLNTKVSQINEGIVHLKDGVQVLGKTIVWTAGVRGAPQAEAWGLPTARAGRVKLLPTLQVSDHPEVYVIGDLANVEANGYPLPMVAPVAIQEGVTAAENIARQITGRELVPFCYRDRGTMVTLGRNAAVAHVFGHAFTGFPAWVLWVSVHLFSLIGFRNRLFVFINWAWDYLFYERNVRLILP